MQPSSHDASAPQPRLGELDEAARRRARRQLLKAALGAVPAVLTVTAGRVQAQQGSGSQVEAVTLDEQAAMLNTMETEGLLEDSMMTADPWDSGLGDPLFE